MVRWCLAQALPSEVSFRYLSPAHLPPMPTLSLSLFDHCRFKRKQKKKKANCFKPTKYSNSQALLRPTLESHGLFKATTASTSDQGANEAG